MKITYPNGDQKEFDKGTSGYDIALSISEGLARNALCIKANDKLIDLTRPIEEDSNIQIITYKDAEGIDLFRHSTAHVLAQAIARLYPNAKNTIGPAVEQGFYYDFDDLDISENDLPKIEEEMKKIIKEELAPKRMVLSKDEAIEMFKDNPYKVEMITDYARAGDTLTAYQQGDFVDLCRGPHIPNTKMLKAIKLTKVAKAYWKADANNKQLTRIYGISFPDNKLLNEWVNFQEEAAKRDHRKIGRELDLFMFHEFSPGSPFFHEKGTFIFNTLQNFMRKEYRKRGYKEVITPLLYNKNLWEISGHWEHYQENMFVLQMDGIEASLKPMNCPSHCLMYKNSGKSYKDLPLRIADFAPLHRNELKGTLSGLTRVRKFSQDDAHVFCRLDQIQEEIRNVMEFIKYTLGEVFKLEYSLEISTKPEKAMGSQEQWDSAENALKDALNSLELPYEINEGDGAFYGPKIDVQVKDALHRSFQLATIQVDFQLPQRFELEYDGEDGHRHTPVMIHRAIFGSLERFIGIIIEHFAGKFPLWINPNQVKILPIADRHNDFAKEVENMFLDEDIRVEVDDRSESIKKKVRDAQLEQFNYILVIGDQEVENKTVTVRSRNNEILGAKNINEFISTIKEEIKNKSL